MRQLRPYPTRAALDAMYARLHNGANWWEHRLRADLTVAFACHLLPAAPVIDLSAGDAVIPRGIARGHTVTLGDYASGYEYVGPISETVQLLDNSSDAIFVCSETLEHVEQPARLLYDIRPKCGSLILSTPADDVDESNPEHIWTFSTGDVGHLLAAAGFVAAGFVVLDLPSYRCQIWAAR